MRSLWLAVVSVLCVFLLPQGAAGGDDDLDWDPARTRVFVVGLLQWQRADLWGSFPDCMPDRRDEQLVEFFREAGVPEDNIVYLQDAEATKSRIQREFIDLLDDSEDDELLVFYFCGHGTRDRDTDQTWFANFDAGDEYSSAWSVRSILATIDEHFAGNRALLLADCCHSGALYDEALQYRDAGIAYAVLTSSYAHNTSTGNWTFSDCLLAGFRGEGQVDLDGDEVVDLQELARYTELELAFIEGQKSMFLADKRFPRKAALADVDEPAEPRIGQRLEVNSNGKWYKATTIDADGDQLEVHYPNFPDSADEWVSADRVRPYQPAQFGDGDKVDVRWATDGKWYPATVRQGWYGLHLVRYDGEDASSDEWVGPGSIRLRSE